MERTAFLAAACMVASGCFRGPLDEVCPSVGPGGLAVSEVRGNQSGLDTWGQWIELFNPTGTPVEAGGLVLRLTNAATVSCTKTSATCDCQPRADGKSSECRCNLDEDCDLDEVCESGACHARSGIQLFDAGLIVDPGGYLVVGRFPAYDLPAHADYGYEAQLGTSLYDSARLEVLTCDGSGSDVVVDSVSWADLPSTGSWSFDGAKALSAAANDDQASWCADDTVPTQPDTNAQGAPGTPGEVNRSCK